MIPRGPASQKGAVNRAKMLEVIQNLGPLGTSELYDLFSAWSVSTVTNNIKALHKAGAIHIHAWTRQLKGHPGPYGRVWAAGPGQDAPRPRPKTHNQTCREYYQRNVALISVTRSGRRSRLNASMNPFAALIR